MFATIFLLIRELSLECVHIPDPFQDASLLFAHFRLSFLRTPDFLQQPIYLQDILFIFSLNTF